MDGFDLSFQKGLMIMAVSAVLIIGGGVISAYVSKKA
jgi:hypothetical protein